MTIHYVVGFVFTLDMQNLLLIRKNRPRWQKDKLNGIGGKIEKDETPLEAMKREFNEEAGVIIPDINWEHFVSLYGDSQRDTEEEWIVYVFRAFDTKRFGWCSSQTDEKLVIVNSDSLPKICVPNLRWLVPMAMDHHLETPILIKDRKG